MKKTALFLSFLSLLVARDNPFLPVKHYNSPTQQESITQFSKYEFSLPANAKIIENIVINYINIDGSIKSLKLDINQSFDWHDSFLISRVKSKEPQLEALPKQNIKQEIKQEETLSKQNDEAKEIKQTIEEKKTIDEKFDSFDIFDLVSIKYNQNDVYVSSSSRVLRYFTLPNPERVVIDFEKTIGYKPQTIKMQNSYFSKVVLGSHNGFFRLVFFPDAKYNIEVAQEPQGVKISIQ